MRAFLRSLILGGMDRRLSDMQRKLEEETDRRAELERHLPELERRLEARMADLIGRTARRTDGAGSPYSTPLNEVVREDAQARWNVKVLGSVLARELYASGLAGPDAPIPAAPIHAGLASQLCRQADIEQPWLHYWCQHMRKLPLYHRKIWEDAYVLQALWEADMMRPGRRGLGFAVGTESLPSIIAAHGVEVVATDLPVGDERVAGWHATEQHAATLDALFDPNMVGEAEFRRLCSFRPVDMNAIPADLAGQFDFCWSVCSLEHVGSIALGLDFVVNAMACLRPGGTAVHTMEFNLENGETIDNWPTVLFQRRHVEDVVARLIAAGHHVAPVDFDPGAGVMDQFVDVPPFAQDMKSVLAYPEGPHLRLSVDGFPCTSLALIVRAAG